MMGMTEQTMANSHAREPGAIESAFAVRVGLRLAAGFPVGFALFVPLVLVLTGFACGFGGYTLFAVDAVAHAAAKKQPAPLKLESPTLDTGKEAAPAGATETVDLAESEGKDGSLAEPGRDLVEKMLNEAATEGEVAEKPKAKEGGKVAASKEETGKDDGPVRLFNTADLFKKPIKGNVPQWERVVGEVKKKVRPFRMMA